MEQVYEQLVSRAKDLKLKHQCSGSNDIRILVALAGPPGSGKSTIAAEVVRRLNQSPTNGHALVLPMDGFHLSQTQLRAMPNSEEAFARRGSHWTFDAEGVVKLIQALHETRDDRSILHRAPAFDHAAKDPVKDGIRITPDTDLIVMEGNWLLFDEQPWSKISQMVDETWFVDVGPSLALTRIASRHVRCGIEACWQDAVARTMNNDMINGEMVRLKLIPPMLRVQSVEE